MKSLLGIVALALLMAGCASNPQAVTGTHKELIAPYRVDSGDRLRVIVFGQADLTNDYAVSQGGTIAMPLIGTVPVRGLTTEEIEANVTALLRVKYLRDPDVSVEVDRYRPFFAMGEVGAAGQYPYVAGMTVQSAIAIAGGFTARADKNSVDVTRSAYGLIETARLRLSDPVMPGDTIYVRERIF